MSSKSRNGEGSGLIISLAFDLDVPIERKAHAMSQRLATLGHGARKRVIVASLAALWDFAELTRHDVTTEELSAMFLNALLGGQMGKTPNAAPDVTDREGYAALIETDTAGIDPDDIALNFLEGGDW